VHIRPTNNSERCKFMVVFYTRHNHTWPLKQNTTTQVSLYERTLALYYRIGDDYNIHQSIN